eukprot:CAMPEP_0114539166 /NCGR_PEP_ID=MMETSP0114-20121206/94_1 /TAXON_ID=31324 /ORGANISM="Goniomonas sp, Strain m" /LENGTH=369 /DNA_ID=CAMNT_0001723253 /DNA_START=16 /DNA_END=1125 /DNA_ORIENTATION=+
MSDAPVAQSRRPQDSAFKQQRLKAWQPILTPRWVIGTFFVVAIAFIPIGALVLKASNEIQEYTVPYEDCVPEVGTNQCSNIKITLEEDWEPPIYVYYQLKNFYQNHRRYVQSRSDVQLRGSFSSEDEIQTADDADSALKECQPALKSSGFSFPGIPSKDLYWYPCGLVALSWFNDTFVLSQKPSGGGESEIPIQSKTGIAWPSDIDKKFNYMSDKWMANNCARIGTFDGQDNEITGYREDILSGPGRIPGNPQKGVYNCWHNVSDEKFIVWMRTAGLPDFKKLWGKIDVKLTKGDYYLDINNRFPVKNFDGKKAFVLSTTRWIGGKNDFLGIAYIVVGCLCLLMGAIFLIKHLVSPRRLGDVNYLVWKP